MLTLRYGDFKHLLREAVRLQRFLRTSADSKQAIMALAEKRAPVFIGK